jgi:selT/selW/selH-like putative selenoprotein
MGSTLGAWFIGNTLSQNMLNTGAFEVYYDGETIFSKIESHRLPSMPELMNDLTIAIERYQQKALGDTSEPAPRPPSCPRRTHSVVTLHSFSPLSGFKRDATFAPRRARYS